MSPEYTAPRTRKRSVQSLEVHYRRGLSPNESAVYECKPFALSGSELLPVKTVKMLFIRRETDTKTKRW